MAVTVPFQGIVFKFPVRSMIHMLLNCMHQLHCFLEGVEKGGGRHRSHVEAAGELG